MNSIKTFKTLPQIDVLSSSEAVVMQHLCGASFIMETEIWKDIVGYEGYYQVSENGKVKSSYGHNGKAILKTSINKKGYLSYTLTKNGQRKGFSCHRLVAIMFIPQGNHNLQVNHIDGDKNNNHFSNLEWCTCKENIHHAIHTGLRTANINLKSNSMFSKSDLVDIRKMFIDGFCNQVISRKYKCDHSTISKIRKGHHYSNNDYTPEDIWESLSKKKRIIFDELTGIFYENIKQASVAKNIPHQNLRYDLLYAVNKKTSLYFI